MVNSENIKEFFKLMNKHEIEYVLIKNDEDKIPYEISDGDDIDILVHPEDYNRYLELIKESGHKVLPGESYKYYFVYKMNNDIYSLKDDLYIHAYDKLSCVSFTNMGLSKIPLDKEIQNSIWKTKRWDPDNNWWIMEDSIILLYLLTRSIFDKKKFRMRYIKEIEKRREYLEDDKFIKLSSLVFFKFTDILLKLVKEKKYNKILNEYKCFIDY